MKFNLVSEQTTLDNFFGSQSKKRETRPQRDHTTAATGTTGKGKRSGSSSRKSATKNPLPDDDAGPPFKKSKMVGQLSPPNSSYDQSSVRNQASPSKRPATSLETPKQASHSGASASKIFSKTTSGQTPGTLTRRRLRTAALVLPTPPATTDKKHNLRNKRPRPPMLRSPSSDDVSGQPSSSYLPTASKLHSPVHASSTRRPLQFSPSTPRTMRLKSTIAPFTTTSPKFVPSSQTPEKYRTATQLPTSSPHSGKMVHRPRTLSNASSSSLSSVPSDIESPPRKQPPVVLAPGSGSPKKGKGNKANPSRSRIALAFRPVGLDFTEVVEDSQSSPLRPRAIVTLPTTPQRRSGAVLVPSSKSPKKASELLADPEDDEDEEAIPDSPSLRAGQTLLPPHTSPVFKVPQPITGPLRFPIERPSRHDPSTSTFAAADLPPQRDLDTGDAEQHESNTDDYIPSSQTQTELVPASPVKVKRFHRPDIHPHQPHDLWEDEYSSSKHEFIPSSQSQVEREMSFPTHHPLTEGSEKVASDSPDSRSSPSYAGLPTSPISGWRHGHHEQAQSVSGPVLPSLPMSHYGSLQDLPSWLFEEETRVYLLEPRHPSTPSTPIKVLKALPKTPESKRKYTQIYGQTEIMVNKSTTPPTPARKHRGSDDVKSPLGFSPRVSPKTPTKLSPLRSAVIAAAAAASHNRLQPKNPCKDPFATLSDDPIVLEGAPPNMPSSSTFPSSDSEYEQYEIGSDAPSVVREFAALFEGSGSFPEDFPESLK